MSIVHGGLDEGELQALGIASSAVLDLSANLHPAGPSHAVLAAARSARLDRYAPADAGPLRAAIAAHERVPLAWVLPTPGATAAIHLVVRAFLAPGDRAVIVGPTFGEYEAAVSTTGTGIEHLHVDAPDFVPPDALPLARLAFVANPNNPTGTHLARSGLTRWLSAERLLLVDAAYEAFVEGAWDAVDLVRAGGNAVVIRSMTKLHAIPGVRLGYVVAAPEVITRLAKLQPSWSLDAVAQAVGPVALGEHVARIAALAEVWATRDRMLQALRAAEVRLGPSSANFILAEVGTGDAAETRRTLLWKGILVRDCASFGLSSWVRVAIPRAADEERVTAALVAALQR